MSQILIRLRQAPPKVAASAVLQERTGKRPGRIVFVADDNHEWGTEELGPKFGIFKLPGVPLTAVERYTAPELIDAVDDPDFDIATARIQKPKRHRRWEFLIDEAEATGPLLDIRQLHPPSNSRH